MRRGLMRLCVPKLTDMDLALSSVTGEAHFFLRVTYALKDAWGHLGDRYDRTTCPLRNPIVD